MGEQYSSQDYQQPQVDAQYVLRDMEEKIRLLKDRILVIGKSEVDEKNRNFSEFQQIKKDIILIKEEQRQMKEMIQKMIEQLSKTSRKEELLIIQRQLDLLREKK